MLFQSHFLIAQLYIEKGQNGKADDNFEKAVTLTTDPILEAYARIYQTGLTSNETDEDKRFDENVKALANMAGREKYANYRSLIYAAAAEIEIKRGGTNAAIALLLKSNSFNQKHHSRHWSFMLAKSRPVCARSQNSSARPPFKGKVLLGGRSGKLYR